MAVFKNKKLRYETFKNLPLHMLKRIRAYVYLRSIWAWIDTVCSNRNSCNRRTSISVTIITMIDYHKLKSIIRNNNSKSSARGSQTPTSPSGNHQQPLPPEIPLIVQ